MSQWKRQIALGLVSSLILVGCGSAKSDLDDRAVGTPPVDGQPKAMQPAAMQPSTPPELTEEQKAELAVGTEAHKAKEVTFHVKGGMFFYVPNAMTVKKGDKVKIIFESVGGMHNFVLDEFKAKTNIIRTGESATVEFIASKTGVFEYYCSVGQHRQNGQKGMLTVVK